MGRSSTDGERGVALVCTLMVTTLLATLGAALVFVVTAESLVGANHRAAQQGFYAADAGIERAIGELRRLSTWQSVPAPGAGSSSADFNDGALGLQLADGTILDLARVTAERQTDSNVFYPDTPDRPVWRLFAHASLERMIAGNAGPAPPYVVVWVADDPDDLDGDPGRDSNDILIVRSHVFGVRGARRAVEATIFRESALDGAVAGGAMRSDVSVIAWREVR
jgi:type IV pilus assembly PilX-like protein